MIDQTHRTPRAIVLVMDSVGIGQAHDAAGYGDAGADTLGHIVEAADSGQADSDERSGPLYLPNLDALGLGRAAQAARGKSLGVPLRGPADALAMQTSAFAFAAPASAPKGSTSGHWEIAGCPVIDDWGYFGSDRDQPYPPTLIEALIERCGLPGVIEVGRASGTQVIARHGEAHCTSGKPIVYTSADSVFQIAAHEETFGLGRLISVCEVARQLCDAWRIARVIARPFTGEAAATFVRTDHRRDFAMPPHALTLLDVLGQAGIPVTTFGKISDLFAHRGIDRSWPVTSLDSVFDQTLACLRDEASAGLLFVNFCDFDSKYGHRRDIAGYARELARFDRRLPDVLAALADQDLLIVTADHGNDPSFPGSDHTREYVPVLLAGQSVSAGDRGRLATFADMGATAGRHLGLTTEQLGGLSGTPIPLRDNR